MQRVGSKEVVTDLSELTELRFFANVCGYEAPDFKFAARTTVQFAKTGLKWRLIAQLSALFHRGTYVQEQGVQF